MPINSPYSSSMEKEIKKAANIINAFFDSSLDIDNSIPVEFIQNCQGLAFLSVIKAGFIWSGKLGTGLVIARLPDGKWSPPSGIGTAGMGFGAEIGGELIDFMIVLGSETAVNTFKRGTQISVGAGLDLALGPYGRSAGANLNAGKGGIVGNYTYSHSRGIFAGIGLHGSTILVRGDLNRTFYGSDVTPLQILSGAVDIPSGACNALYDAIARAERDGRQQNYSIPTLPTPSYSQNSETSSYQTDASPNYYPRSDSSVERTSDPRLSRLGSYKSEAELYAEFAKKKQPESLNTGAISAPLTSAPKYPSASSNIGATSAPIASAPKVPFAPSYNSQQTPPIPSPAQGAEIKDTFNRVIGFVTARVPHADVSLFKENCKLYGQDKINAESYFGYLRSICSIPLLKELVPELVRLLPTQAKRTEIWSAYCRDVLMLRSHS